MKNNKGFTLIELLAVIVILAIIALITVPTILNIVNDARKGAAENSAAGIYAAAENYYMTTLLDQDGNFVETTFTCGGTACSIGTEENAPKLDFSGTIPETGTITISTEGVITFTNQGTVEEPHHLTINGYKCDYSTTAANATGTWECK